MYVSLRMVSNYTHTHMCTFDVDTFVGEMVGVFEGRRVGDTEGTFVGRRVGEMEGTFVGRCGMCVCVCVCVKCEVK